MASLSFAPCGLTPLSLSSNANRYFSFASFSCRTRSLSASLFSLQTGAGAGAFSSTLRLSNKSYQRRGGALVVCEAGTGTGKKPDQAAKRMRQNAKKRLRNKSRKSEIRTRTRKVVWELGALRKKKDATPDDVLPIEKMISVIYSKIDKAVRKGVLHKNTASHRKSRLARRKRTLLIYRGWYNPAAAAENPTPTSVSA